MTSVFIVDAFTNEKFCGNQAAVCLFTEKKTDEEYQKIAAEFNLSETAFPLPLDSNDFKTAQKFNLRWFTPKTEVPLCGHATLAASHVIFKHAESEHSKLHFDTLSGPAEVEKISDGQYKINFPLYALKSFKIGNLQNPLASKFEEVEAPGFMHDIVKHLDVESKFRGAVYSSNARTLIIVLDETLTKEELGAINHNADQQLKCDPNGEYLEAVIITMKPKDAVKQGFVDKNGKPFDYASRYFGPWVGIAEDPATGSSHCVLAALWRELNEKEEFYAFQCFPGRGAQFIIKPVGDRVEITGDAVTIVEGKANF
ncbi:hypothetical protein QR680_010066 [Steinernema hermaphroditum]|uniref:Phenazine biosynthesis-like domain-containing protein n=1 Tax=Steinernema hermaphroditum TaxID=289476 RepID=A0AA39MA04_9BILA|nr:hypothetical protein QR680_010066 [Steinernema hermaphroditum]